MSVSLYYGAERSTPLTEEEANAAEAVAAAFAKRLKDDDEGMNFYAEPTDGQVLEGSTKMPVDPIRTESFLLKLLDGLTQVRRSVPGATWHVQLDGQEIPWDGERGFFLPGLKPRWWHVFRR